MKKIHILFVVLLISFGAQKSSSEPVSLVAITALVIAATAIFSGAGIGAHCALTFRKRVELELTKWKNKFQQLKTEIPVRLRLTNVSNPEGGDEPMSPPYRLGAALPVD